MNAKKPVTKEMVLAMLDDPKNAELKAEVDAQPQWWDLIIEAAVRICNEFNSVEEFKSALKAFEQAKTPVTG